MAENHNITEAPPRVLSKRRRGLVRALVVVIVLVVITGLVTPAIPRNAGYSSKLYFCTQCGAAKHVLKEWDRESDEPTVTSEFDSTPLSQWYDAHYPEPCGHEWCFNHFTVYRFFRWGTFSTNPSMSEAGSGFTPPLLNLSDEERRDLESRFEDDPIACKAYLKSHLEPRYP